MSSDYSYDEEGTLWPFFVFTLTSLVTVPLTYVVVASRTRDPAAAFPRTKTDFRLKDADLVDAQRKLERRKQHKVWMAMMALAGWAIMAYTMYLIYVTPATVQKLWNPYDILGIDEVCLFLWVAPSEPCPFVNNLKLTSAGNFLVLYREADQEHLQAALAQVPPRQGQAR